MDEGNGKQFAEIFVYREGADHIEEGFTIDQLPGLLTEPHIIFWLDIRGENEENIPAIKDLLLNVFKFHYLTVEDCIETRNAPKVEAFPDYLYFIVHGVKPDDVSPAKFQTRELDGYLGPNFVITFHIERFRSIKNVKQQVRGSTFACQKGAAYLLHQILDNLVDYYMPLVDEYDDVIDVLEERVLKMKRGSSVILEDIM